MSLSDNLTRLRVTDGRSIEEVAEGSGLSVGMVAAIESGRPSIPRKSLKALAAYFGVSAETLLK